MPTLEIKSKDISFSKDGKTVYLVSSDLATGLVQSRKYTVEKLREKVGSIDLKDISIDEKGRVKISNARFASQVKMMRDKVPAKQRGDVNVLCNIWCGRKKAQMAEIIESIPK